MTIIDKDATPCEHLIRLQEFLAQSGLEIFGEWTQSPDGWVNIHCRRCERYYRVDLHEGEPDNALAGSR